MVLSEHLPPGWEIEVIASDLSLKSLMKAKEGFYPAARVTGIPETYLHKYFDAKNDGYQVKDNIRSLVRFDYHNLKFDSGLKNLDIVFCRNVLIYFDEAAQKNVIDHFWDAMAGHAYLFIGHSESLFGMQTRFEFIKTDWACLYGKMIGDRSDCRGAHICTDRRRLGPDAQPHQEDAGKRSGHPGGGYRHERELRAAQDRRLNPDVIVLDLEMPELDGIGYLEKRMENGWEVPVVILSAVAKKGAEVTMKALSLGASDFITKPSGKAGFANRETAEELISMVKGFGAAYRKAMGTKESSRPVAPPKKTPAPRVPTPAVSRKQPDWPELQPKQSPAPPEIIAIGISTGGPNALRQVFAGISENLKVPIVVVQHMPPGFTAEFANSLNKICPLEVKEAVDGDILKPGRILIAPGDRHIRVEKRRLAAVARLEDGRHRQRTQTVGGRPV
jgi:chemotaxis response regulator CheB